MTTTWFVTGTSSGLGRLLTEKALERGDRVAATLRRPEALDDLRAAHGDRLLVARLDVTDAGQVRKVVDEAFTALGTVDVIVNNAGRRETPLRLPLGSDTYRDIRASLVARLTEHDTHRETALSVVRDDLVAP